MTSIIFSIRFTGSTLRIFGSKKSLSSCGRLEAKKKAGSSATAAEATSWSSSRRVTVCTTTGAWVIPAALGGGNAARYELLGRRAINQCYAYLRPRLGAAIA